MKQSSLDEPNLEGDMDEGVFVNQPANYQNYYDNQDNPPELRPDTPPPVKAKGTLNLDTDFKNL